ncbi:hypothetical protein ACNOYE_05055 [Nannocystaceae bacterium ST9]
MDKLKTYAIPIVGVLLLLAYWLVVRPMLAEQAAEPGKPATETK